MKECEAGVWLAFMHAALSKGYTRPIYMQYGADRPEPTEVEVAAMVADRALGEFKKRYAEVLK